MPRSLKPAKLTGCAQSLRSWVCLLNQATKDTILDRIRLLAGRFQTGSAIRIGVFYAFEH